MAGINDRIRRLEQRQQPDDHRGYSEVSPELRQRLLDRVLLGAENHRRAREGLPLLPEPEETPEEIAHSRESLEFYRRQPTYDHGEGLRFIQAWEQSLREKESRANSRREQP